MNQEEPGHHSSVVYPPSNSNGIPGMIPPDELQCNSNSFASSKNQTKVPNNSDSNSTKETFSLQEDVGIIELPKRDASNSSSIFNNCMINSKTSEDKDGFSTLTSTSNVSNNNETSHDLSNATKVPINICYTENNTSLTKVPIASGTSSSILSTTLLSASVKKTSSKPVTVPSSNKCIESFSSNDSPPNKDTMFNNFQQTSFNDSFNSITNEKRHMKEIIDNSLSSKPSSERYTYNSKHLISIINFINISILKDHI